MSDLPVVPTARRMRRAGFTRKRSRYTSEAIRRGLDDQGRFIGPRDVDRGFRYFWNSRQRAGQTPIARDFWAENAGLGTGRGMAGVPKPLRSGLTFAILREIHRRVTAGEHQAVLAREFNVSSQAISQHINGSASMRAALAEAPAR